MSPFSLNRPAHHARTRHRLRPRLDALEDRFLLTAGDLDTTFGSGGVVLTSFPLVVSKQTTESTGFAKAVQIQSDGKIVAAGQGSNAFAVARYNTDGSLDPTFGSGGKVVTDFGHPSEDEGASDLAIQPDGKIVVVGRTEVPAGNGKNAPPSIFEFAIARYNTNGTLDTSFGPNHNGLVTTKILGFAEALSVVIQPDGKILVGGNTSPGSGPAQCTLVRYNPNGTLDTSFGSGGILTPTLVSGVPPFLLDVALETVNGTTEIVVAGTVNSWDGIIARFYLDGSLDTSFGSNGNVIVSSLQGRLAIQPDGKIVEVGGFWNSQQGVQDPAVARLDINGSLDATFNPNGPTPGVLVIVIAGTNGAVFENGVIQPDGKIVAAGTSTGPQMLLTRLNADGSLDPTFGSNANGVVLDSLTGGAWAFDVALQADGKFVTAGVAPSGGDSFAIARFLGDTTTTTALAVVALQPTADASAPSPILVPLALDDPGFLDTVGSGKRRHTTSISP
jgi:uncharacterized delta-60 repeat protein